MSNTEKRVEELERQVRIMKYREAQRVIKESGKPCPKCGGEEWVPIPPASMGRKVPCSTCRPDLYD